MDLRHVDCRGGDAARGPYFYPFRYLPVVGFTLGRFVAQFPQRLAYWIWVSLLEALLGVLILMFAARFADRGFGCFAARTRLLSSPYALELE